jgi:hypothetical protein
MQAIRVETVVENDGELHLSRLPCRKGDHVEAIVLLPEGRPASDKEAARERFLEQARASQFRSAGKYPSRDELHDRA